MCYLLAAPWTSRREPVFLPYVHVINCFPAVFCLQFPPSSPNIFFCFSNYQSVVVFLLFTLPLSVRHEERTFFSHYVQSDFFSTQDHV